MINKSVVLAERDGVFYEGDDTQLWAINPGPVISPAKFDPPISAAQNAGVVFSSLYFREDYFDSTTRIRRGRFYGLDGTGSNREWPHGKVSSWPRAPLPLVLPAAVQMHAVYRRLKIDVTRNMLLNDIMVSLGSAGYESDWRIIEAEQTVNDELLFTIKSSFPFGILPVLKTDDKEIKRSYENVLDAALKYGPVPVVDVCRESACVILRRHFGLAGDLGEIIENIPKNQVMVVSAAQIINRLHPRGKTAAQLKLAAKGIRLRPVIDDDAALAVRLFGFLLVELGYGAA